MHQRTIKLLTAFPTIALTFFLLTGEGRSQLSPRLKTGQSTYDISKEQAAKLTQEIDPSWGKVRIPVMPCGVVFTMKTSEAIPNSNYWPYSAVHVCEVKLPAGASLKLLKAYTITDPSLTCAIAGTTQVHLREFSFPSGNTWFVDWLQFSNGQDGTPSTGISGLVNPDSHYMVYVWDDMSVSPEKLSPTCGLPYPEMHSYAQSWINYVEIYYQPPPPTAVTPTP